MVHQAPAVDGTARASAPATTTPTAVPVLTRDWAVAAAWGGVTASTRRTRAGEARPAPVPPTKTRATNQPADAVVATPIQPSAAVVPATRTAARGRRSETRAATAAASEYETNWAAAAQPTTGASAGRSATSRGAKRPTPNRAMPYVEAMSRVPASATATLLAGDRCSTRVSVTITTVLS